MSQPSTTRRDLLRFGTTAAAYAAGAAIVTGGVAAESAAEGATVQTVSPELLRLIQDHRQSNAIIDEWYATTWNPAVDRHKAAQEAVPHTEIRVQGYRNVLNEDTPPHTFSTASKMDVARCKGILSIPYSQQSTDPRWQETYRAARRLTAAVKWRERKLARLQRQFDALGVCDREDDLWVPITAATKAILAFPIANAADLGAKLDHMELIGTVENDPVEYHAIVRADVRRLSGGEA